MGRRAQLVAFPYIVNHLILYFLIGRAWRREFGQNSEWGQKGVFRIIAMEQFASSLVEDAKW